MYVWVLRPVNSVYVDVKLGTARAKLSQALFRLNAIKPGMRLITALLA